MRLQEKIELIEPQLIDILRRHDKKIITRDFLLKEMKYLFKGNVKIERKAIPVLLKIINTKYNKINLRLRNNYIGINVDVRNCCLCGCGLLTNNFYRPGHNIRVFNSSVLSANITMD